MQYLRQSLVSICVCLYAFLAIALGLSWLLRQATPPIQVDSYGFYRVEDGIENMAPPPPPLTKLAPKQLNFPR